MKVLLVQLDGKHPNRALARAGHHHRERGDDVTFRAIGNTRALERGLWDETFDRVYASLIFEHTRPLARRLLERWPRALLGGTGWDLRVRLEEAGVPTEGPLDLSFWPGFKSSLGFTQRGCRLACEFCHVPKAEGANQAVARIADIYRGEPWPRDLILLDNDPFGQPDWRGIVREIEDGDFRVSWTQGINARLIKKTHAEALGRLYHAGRLWDDAFSHRRLYTAFDNAEDLKTFTTGMRLLIDAGIPPADISVYMLAGYWPGETDADRVARARVIRDLGAQPYPMPFERWRKRPGLAALNGLARWCGLGLDKTVPWETFVAADYRPEKLGVENPAQQEMFT